MLVFTKLTYQNFLSSGSSPITIELNKSHLNLIAGKNGTGKSTIMDALCFALYGKPYRNITKPQLINTINLKKCMVEVCFEIGKKKYRIVRGMKPNIFEIYEDDVILNQNPNVRDHQKMLETQILKMNYRAFTQVVIMGSGAYIPFMELVPGQRREFIEDLLDIRIFSIMNGILKDRLKLTNETLKDIGTEIKLLKEKATLQQTFIEKQKKEKGESIQQMEEEITALMKDLDGLYEWLDNNKNAIGKLTTQASKYDVHEELSDLRMSSKRLIDVKSKEENEKAFYEKVDTCPTCKQEIGDDHRQSIISDSIARIDSYEGELAKIKATMDDVAKKLKKHESLSEEISELNKEVSDLNQQIHSKNLMVENVESKIQQSRGDTTSIDEEQEKLKKYAKDIVAFDKQKKKLLEDAQFQQVASSLLQDTGIKAKIIKQYVPVINKLVNKYLGKLDFFCQFNLDENFNETVKSRYRDTFSYHSFSEGQKLRIDLSLIFTWRDIARMKNSVTTNLVIFDELFDSSMDGVGMDLALGLLDDLKDSNVFVISHREGSFDKFPNVVQLETKNNFTVIA